MVRRDSKQEGEQLGMPTEYGREIVTSILTLKTDKLPTLPSDLEEEMAKLDDMFTVSTEKLKQISKRFREELEEGMS